MILLDYDSHLFSELGVDFRAMTKLNAKEYFSSFTILQIYNKKNTFHTLKEK